MEDNQIVDLYLCRDESAIGYTSDKYGNRLRNLAHNITQDLYTAQECENDTYLQAWNWIPPHEPRDYLFAFLARITRHIALDRCREQNSLKRTAFICELSAEMEQCIPSPGDTDSQMDALALRDAINQFLATLNAEKRNIFVRRYWFMDSVVSISRLYGVSQSKVKSILFRVRNQLRAFLEKEGYEL